MSQAIGSLFISLGLDTAALAKGAKQAQGQMGKLASDISNKLGKLGDIPGIKSLQGALIGISRNSAAALGTMAGAAVASLGALSVSAMNTAKEIQQLSVLANATPEEFQKWGYAAEQVGVSQEKMGDILKDVNDRVGDFIATGGGPMKDFFERIAPKVGVTAEQFRKLSGPDALQLYVSSLEKAGVNQQDFTFFMEAMASDATALLPILKNNGAQAKAFGDRLEALGGVMGNETVARLSKMRQAMSEIATVMGGVRNTLGAAFAPVIASLGAGFVSLMTRGSGLRLVFDGIAVVARTVADVFASVVNIISHVVSAIWNVSGAVLAAIDNFTGLSTAISWIWSVTGGAVVNLLTGISRILDATGGLGGAFTLLGEVASGVWEGMVTSAGAIPDGLSAIWERVKAGFLRMVLGLQQTWYSFIVGLSQAALKNGLDGMAAQLGDVAETAGMAVESTADAMNRASAAAETAAAAASGRFTEGFEIAKDALDRLNITVDESKTGMGGAGGGGLGDGLDQVAKKAGGAAEKLSSLQKVMKGLNEQIAKLQATAGLGELDTKIWEKQNEAQVKADSIDGKLIDNKMRQISAMERLRDATKDWQQTLSGAFSEFITKGGSFKSMLSSIIGKLAEMMAQQAFSKLWSGTSFGGAAKGVLGWLGIGANANGTDSWRGGLTRVNERGGEIMNLPAGTQIIPNDISKRMADNVSKGGGAVTFHVDARGSVEGEAERFARYLKLASPALIAAAAEKVKNDKDRGRR